MWQGFFRGSRRAGFAVVCVGLCVSLALLYPGQLRPVLVDPLGLCMACAWADDTMWTVGIMANVRTAYYIWTADAGRTDCDLSQFAPIVTDSGILSQTSRARVNRLVKLSPCYKIL